MKYLVSLLFIFLSIGVLSAQNDKSSRKSPPVVEKGVVDGVEITIDYSSPSIRGRDLWDGLVPYDKVWRTGANEASKITVSKDVMVEGQKLAAGEYGLFTIPTASSWTVIFNKVADQWGAYGYDESEDALRVTVTPVSVETHTEAFTIEIGESGFDMVWGSLSVPIQIKSAMQ